MNVIAEIQRINAEELQKGYTNTSASWHTKYAESAWCYIGNLPNELSEGDLICVMSQYGEVEDVNLVRDEETGKSKGFAFLKYEDARSCVLAVDNFAGSKVLGRSIRVDHVEKYRLPKHLREKEEEEEGEAALESGPGHAYKGQTLANSFNVTKGQDLFGPVPDDSKHEERKSTTSVKEKRERKERRNDVRREREERRGERDEKKREKRARLLRTKSLEKDEFGDDDEKNGEGTGNRQSLHGKTRHGRSRRDGDKKHRSKKNSDMDDDSERVEMIRRSSNRDKHVERHTRSTSGDRTAEKYRHAGREEDRRKSRSRSRSRNRSRRDTTANDDSYSRSGERNRHHRH